MAREAGAGTFLIVAAWNSSRITPIADLTTWAPLAHWLAAHLLCLTLGLLVGLLLTRSDRHSPAPHTKTHAV